jgi:hypothetical protein
LHLELPRVRLLLKALDADGDGRVSEEDFLYGD